MFKIKKPTLCYPTPFRLGCHCHQKPKPSTLSFRPLTKFNGIELVRTPARRERMFENVKVTGNEDVFAFILQRASGRLMEVTPKLMLPTLALCLAYLLLSVSIVISKQVRRHNEHDEQVRSYFIVFFSFVYGAYCSALVSPTFAVSPQYKQLVLVFSVFCVPVIMYEMKCAKLNTFAVIIAAAVLLLSILIGAEAYKVSFSEVLVATTGGALIAGAADGKMKSVIAGFSLALKPRFKVGDFINGKSFEGQVLCVSLTETTLVGSDFFQTIVPNSVITKELSRVSGYFRFHFNIEVKEAKEVKAKRPSFDWQQKLIGHRV